jgi:tripartite-type tricarboxylate transporter receptor subunit TctC
MANPVGWVEFFTRPNIAKAARKCWVSQALDPIYALFAVTLLVVTPAAAQDWPSGTVRVIVPYAAGGPLDFPCRLLLDRLAAQTKGTFILEHRAGAGGAVGAQAVVQAPPDGGTFLFTSSSLAAADNSASPSCPTSRRSASWCPAT